MLVKPSYLSVPHTTGGVPFCTGTGDGHGVEPFAVLFKEDMLPFGVPKCESTDRQGREHTLGVGDDGSNCGFAGSREHPRYYFT